MLQCGARGVMGKSKLAISCLVLVLGIFYFWAQRGNVDLKIGDVIFRVPSSAIVSGSSTRSTNGGLDNTEGAFLEFPNGPYYGKWGILLQSNRERKAKGFPPSFDASSSVMGAAEAFKKTTFGWYQCGESCGRETWYFRRAPTPEDSVFSVNSIVCHETEICELLFAYRDVDVTVSLQKNNIENASQVMEQVSTMLAAFTNVGD